MEKHSKIKIEKDKWDRKEIYNFFSKTTNPFYMMSFIVDVTELKKFTNKNDCSFYYALIYLCIKSMKKIENFQYVCQNNEIYLIDERIPSFTDRKEGSDLFYITSVPAGDDIVRFCKVAKEASHQQQEFIDISQECEDLAYFSCVPTLRLTALTNELDVLDPIHSFDNIPRIAWGKYEERNGRIELTISMEVNHRFIDGIHIEKFASYLDDMIKELSNK